MNLMVILLLSLTVFAVEPQLSCTATEDIIEAVIFDNECTDGISTEVTSPCLFSDQGELHAICEIDSIGVLSATVPCSCD